jgi:hypothetical protein
MIVLVNGGIGNQLFQFCYALEYKRVSGKKVSLMPLNDKDGERIFGLGPFLEMFPDIKVIEPTRLFRIAQKFSILLNRIFRGGTLARHLNPIFTFDSVHDYKVKRKSCFVFGYFQNKELVSGVLDSVGPKLITALDSVEIDLNYLNRNIIHVRGGDYKYHHDSMGILNSDYFRNSIAEKGLVAEEILCLTDDLNIATQICRELGVIEIASSSTLSPHQSLKAMAYSNNLICANSTFSWWGGVLSCLQGGNVVIPSPWFKGYLEDPIREFSYPGFTLVDSNFI